MGSRLRKNYRSLGFIAHVPTHTLRRGDSRIVVKTQSVKILVRCNEAITNKDNGKKGKVIIIDIVIRKNGFGDDDDNTSLQTKLFYDMQMIVFLAGKQRNEKIRCTDAQRQFASWSNLPVLNSFLHRTYDSSTGKLEMANQHTGVSASTWVAWAINPNLLSVADASPASFHPSLNADSS
ncbi:hypothetical protein TIFTF001_020573 [Ficus carica]|uniref:Uncharacterized protein n=1 Tax=Ficus carica TaxID=3494 RepID=A0AA88AGB7_FICCA|nr:hypothetical protein TIFTF001_020573 [Ficus carica]